MKKYILLMSAILLAFSLSIGCGKKDTTAKKDAGAGAGDPPAGDAQYTVVNNLEGVSVTVNVEGSKQVTLESGKCVNVKDWSKLSSVSAGGSVLCDADESTEAGACGEAGNYEVKVNTEGANELAKAEKAAENCQDLEDVEDVENLVYSTITAGEGRQLSVYLSNSDPSVEKQINLESTKGCVAIERKQWERLIIVYLKKDGQLTRLCDADASTTDSPACVEGNYTVTSGGISSVPTLVSADKANDSADCKKVEDTAS